MNKWEINMLIQQDCIKLIKSDSKYIYNIIRFLFKVNSVIFWSFYSSKNSETTTT